MGRSAAGLIGMRLDADDEVIALRVPAEDDDLLVITERGFGKRTPITEYRETGRGAKGVRTIAAKAEDERGTLVGAMTVSGDEDLLVMTASGIVTRLPVEEVRRMSRSTSGVRIQRVRGDEDRVSAIALVIDPGDADDLTEAETPTVAAEAELVEPLAEESALDEGGDPAVAEDGD
jgi:DNA gyrase subunit A